ncbi:MAG: hypothetical protein ACM3QS_05630 [Bacteroidota bacterium]
MTVIRIVNELMAEDLVQLTGKKESAADGGVRCWSSMRRATWSSGWT